MRIGILTFHAVYNYGAVLQAYALQKALEDLGIENEIIHFSRPVQKNYIGMYPNRNGLKSLCKNVLMLPLHKKRKQRLIKFDEFINHQLKLTEKCYDKEEELKGLGQRYDCIIVGSDQVWNTTKSLDFSMAYFLDFVQGHICRKLGYAVSIGNAQFKDLEKCCDAIKQFDFISVREDRGAEVIAELTGIKPPVVADPTLLINSKHYKKLYSGVSVSKEEKYIFYYSLDGMDKKKRNFDMLKELGRKYNMKIKAILPERPFGFKNFEIINDAGPEEFLAILKNAALVCTNSFHGTALSIALEKPFYVLEAYDGKDDRKLTLLKKLSCGQRMLSSLEQVKAEDDYSLDYNDIRKKLWSYRKYSDDILQKMLTVE